MSYNSLQQISSFHAACNCNNVVCNCFETKRPQPNALTHLLSLVVVQLDLQMNAVQIIFMHKIKSNKWHRKSVFLLFSELLSRDRLNLDYKPCAMTSAESFIHTHLRVYRSSNNISDCDSCWLSRNFLLNVCPSVNLHEKMTWFTIITLYHSHVKCGPILVCQLHNVWVLPWDSISLLQITWHEITLDMWAPRFKIPTQCISIPNWMVISSIVPQCHPQFAQIAHVRNVHVSDGWEVIHCTQLQHSEIP